MNATDRYFFNINRKFIKQDIIIVLVILVLSKNSILMGGSLVFLIRVFFNMSRFLDADSITSKSNDSMNLLLTLPFSRELIYKTYIKMLLFYTIIITSISVIGIVFVSYSGTMTNERILTIDLLYVFSMVFIVVVVAILAVNQITHYSDKPKKIVSLIIIHPIVLGSVSALISFKNTVVLEIITTRILLIGGITSIILILVFISVIKKAYKIFVLDHRGY